MLVWSWGEAGVPDRIPHRPGHNAHICTRSGPGLSRSFPKTSVWLSKSSLPGGSSGSGLCRTFTSAVKSQPD